MRLESLKLRLNGTVRAAPTPEGCDVNLGRENDEDTLVDCSTLETSDLTSEVSQAHVSFCALYGS